MDGLGCRIATSVLIARLEAIRKDIMRVLIVGSVLQAVDYSSYAVLMSVSVFVSICYS